MARNEPNAGRAGEAIAGLYDLTGAPPGSRMVLRPASLSEPTGTAPPPAASPPVTGSELAGSALVTCNVSSKPMPGSPTYGDRLFALRWERLRLSQAAFAERYGLTLGAVKDTEQGRWQPPRALCLLIAAIADDPERMARIAKRERPAMGRR